jgi:hypothetical protein
MINESDEYNSTPGANNDQTPDVMEALRTSQTKTKDTGLLVSEIMRLQSTDVAKDVAR